MKFEDLKCEDVKSIKDTMLEYSVNLIATCQECKNTMPIDAFYRDMEMAHRIIYLTNVLNDVEDYDEMKFFEFSGSDFGYYALIGAISQDEAIKYYAETVGDIEDEDSTPTEITKEKAKIKLLKICIDGQEKYEAMEEFAGCINQNEPYLILIDEALL